ncbi:MAG: N-6 DNA methylase [Coriobacteriales bacterium]|nr:N-6 DNA methylase [Coriobacteriales bacterium]
MSYDVQLRYVTRLVDHTHFDIPRNRVVTRKGPYPYYGDLFERFLVDDYGIDAESVLFISAAGKVLNSEGGFRAALEHGRCGSSAFAHTLVPHDPRDGAYLLACLTTLPNAIDYIAGANNLQTLDELAVLRIAIPWPARATRDAYTAAVVASDKELAEARKSSVVDENMLEGLLAKRSYLVRSFMDFGEFEGYDCTPVEPEPYEALPAYSDARAERAREELKAIAVQEAVEKGGLVLHKVSRDALGPLACIATQHTGLLGREDAAWELAPLVLVRKCVPQDIWREVMEHVAQKEDRTSLIAALDKALDYLAQNNSCFSFLPNLSFKTSLLTDAQLIDWLTILDGIDTHDLTRLSLRTAFDLDRGAPAVPVEVAGIAGLFAMRLTPHEGTVYMPHAAENYFSDIPVGYVPGCHVYAQCESAAALLKMILIRGFVAATDFEFVYGPVDGCAPEQTALVHDAFPQQTCDLVLLDIPQDTQNPWSEMIPQKDDPRWVLGAPTRMRSTYAWIQQALSHLAPKGKAIILMPTFELQTMASVDRENRIALVEQGRVQVVVALPSRIWGDGRVPYSLVVLGTQGSAPQTLMIDATMFDTYDDDAVLRDDPQRSLVSEECQRIDKAFCAWLYQNRDTEDVEIDCAGFSALVSQEELVANGSLLAPWLYV